MLLENVSEKRKFRCNLIRKTFILSLSKLIINSKTYFTNVVHYGILFEKVKMPFVHKAVQSQAYQTLIQGIFPTYIRNISRTYQYFLFGISAIYFISFRHILLITTFQFIPSLVTLLPTCFPAPVCHMGEGICPPAKTYLRALDLDLFYTNIKTVSNW